MGPHAPRSLRNSMFVIILIKKSIENCNELRKCSEYPQSFENFRLLETENKNDFMRCSRGGGELKTLAKVFNFVPLSFSFLPRRVIYYPLSWRMSV